MSKSTITYQRKTDGIKVEVLMEPSGWPGYKKIYQEDGNVFRLSNAEFEQGYELHTESSLFKKFINGIRRENNR